MQLPMVLIGRGQEGLLMLLLAQHFLAQSGDQRLFILDRRFAKPQEGTDGRMINRVSAKG